MENSCRVVVGRLMEIRVAAGYRTVDDVDAMIAMITAAFERLPVPTQVVIAADWRQCPIFAADVADRALKMLKDFNDRIERSAILHRLDAPSSVLQIMRLIRETGFEHRRVFTDAGAVKRFLGEKLDLAEQAQLDTFLST
jgi:hypothetical protein